MKRALVVALGAAASSAVAFVFAATWQFATDVGMDPINDDNHWNKTPRNY